MRRLLILALLLVALPCSAQRLRYFGGAVTTTYADYVPYTGAVQDVNLGSYKLKLGGWSLGTINVGETLKFAFGVDEKFRLNSGGDATFGGKVTATGFTLSDLQTAPSAANDSGTKGEIRITADFVYVCIATDTWVRAPLATWP